MKKFIITSIFVFTAFSMFSQGASDALRYSFLTHNGDARFMGMAGAFGALGGNISTFNYNPAGIGLFRRSDASITISFLRNKNTAAYNSGLFRDSQSDFLLDNAGAVVTSDYFNLPMRGEWKKFQVGVTYNMLKNFENRVFITGPNTANSIGDMYAALADGYSVSDIEDDLDGIHAFDVNPAWYAYLFNEVDGSPGSYVSAAPPGGVQQSKLIESWGSLKELAFTFGGNYNDRLYVGATIGIPLLEYHEVATYEEDALEANIPDDTYRYLFVKDYLDTRAYGVNLKLGAIFRVNEMLRFGAAFHTPTYYYDINDEWMTRIGSDWDEYDSEVIDSPLGYYEYLLSTPMKAIGSIALVFNKSGLVSLDYEYVDYSTAKLDSDDYNFADENNDIKAAFQSTSNIRIGTEWKLMNFSFRGGYSLYGSPYKNDGDNGKVTSFSLGAGYREGNYYFDVAWVRTKSNDTHRFYNYGGVFTNPASIKNELSRLLFTFGVRF